MPLQLDALFSRAKHPSHAYLSPDTTSAAPTSFYSPSWKRAPKVTSPPSDQRDIEILVSSPFPLALKHLLLVMDDDAIPPPERARLALNLARACLAVPTSSTSSKSPVNGGASPVRSEYLRALCALLLGICALNPCPESSLNDADNDADLALERLLEALVGIFIRGGIRPSTAPPGNESLSELARVVLNGRAASREAWTAWTLTRRVVEELKLRSAAVDLDYEDYGGKDQGSRSQTRTLISVEYLRALLCSSSSFSASSALALGSSSSFLIESSPSDTNSANTYFARCVTLGVSLSLFGIRPGELASASTGDDHADSLVWKARKRLELTGHTREAVQGIPGEGEGYERWEGGAVEKARREVAEMEERRDRRHELQALKQGVMLAAPRRLKGKRIVEQRLGSYDPTACIPTSTSASSTPMATAALSGSLMSTGSPNRGGVGFARTHSTTSLPSLHRKQSIDLLAAMAAHQGAGTLKSPTPISLPTLIGAQGLFSPTEQASAFEAVTEASREGSGAWSEYGESEDGQEEEQQSKSRSSRAMFDSLARLRRTVSRLVLNASASTPPTAIGAAAPDADLSPLPPNHSLYSSSPPILTSPYFALPPALSFSPASSSTPSLASTSPPPAMPAPIRTMIPKIAFQPSSFHTATNGEDGGLVKASSSKIFRPSSPRGERMSARWTGNSGGLKTLN